MAGSRIGPYEVLGLLGAGGMGEVYRARDAKLQRDVAIKILPPAFANDAERLARFEREAQVLASLNHPNIAAIYGFEDKALILELVDGPTLADRIAQSPIPIEDALPIARQIADALEAAHEHGVIHRDLKPANIKLRADGTVKVLDFGLAKLSDPNASNAPNDPNGRHALSLSPTLMSPAATQMGIILGTAAYMSPEQARGKVVDKRADIWAFGCVLYEMLTGTRAFEDEDVSLTLSKVLRVDADLDALPRDLPPHVAQTIRVCLKKDPKQRAADIHDVRLALEGTFASASPEVAPATTAVPRARHSFVVATLAAATALILAGAAAWALWPRTEPPAVVRFDYDLPAEHAFRRTGRSVIALSPDGRSIVYNTTQGLYVRSMDDLGARLIQGTGPDMANPFFSPDGQSVAYWTADDQLKRIPLAGGAPVAIAKITIPSGASWEEDGTILVGQPEGIIRVRATGGTPDLVIRAADGEAISGPSLLPGGDLVLFSVTKDLLGDRWNSATIVVQSLSSGERRDLVKGGADATYVPTGHLVYALEDGLFAVAFDAERGTVSGGPIPLMQGLLRAPATGAANYGVSRNGTLVHLRGGAASLRTLAWIGRDGRQEAITIEPSSYLYPRISPDGTRVALDDRNEANDLWIWHFSLTTRTRLVTGETGGQYAIWSADSARLFFDPGSGDIHAKAASNVGQIDVIAKGVGGPGGRSPSPYFLTPSGTELVYRDQQNPKTNDDVNILSLKDGTPRPLLNGPSIERNAELSPNGRWMAYESDESGRFEIYVRPFPNVDEDRVLISNAGGIKPLWSRDGRELYYLEPAAPMPRLMSVAVVPGAGTFSPGARTRLLDWPFMSTGEGRTYDVAPDGKRFLGILEGSSQQDATQQIIVTEHWIEELKRLVAE